MAIISAVPNRSGDTIAVAYPPTNHQDISATGTAITLGKESILLSYAGATAITLEAPTADMDGFEMTIVSSVAQAHVITATNLINGNNDTLTWGAAIANNCTLRAEGSEWLTMNLTGVTVG